MRRGDEHPVPGNRRGRASILRRGRRTSGLDQHLRGEPLPAARARARRSSRAVQPDRRRRGASVRRAARRRLDGASGGPVGPLRPGAAGRRIRGVCRTGGRARRGGRRPPRDRDPDGPARARTGVGGGAGGRSGYRGPRERHVHPGRPYPPRIDARAGGRSPARARSRCHRRELRRGTGPGTSARARHGADRRRRPSGGSAQRRRPFGGGGPPRVSRHARLHGRTGAGVPGRGGVRRRRVLRNRPGAHHRDRRRGARPEATATRRARPCRGRSLGRRRVSEPTRPSRPPWQRPCTPAGSRSRWRWSRHVRSALPPWSPRLRRCGMRAPTSWTSPTHRWRGCA